MKIVNATLDRSVCQRCRLARTWWTRTRGLIGHPSLAEDEGLLIERCDGVHMMFMRYPIDVIFLDRDGVVVGMRENLRPWRMTRLYRGAKQALELSAGAIARAGVELGHRLHAVEDESSSDPGAVGSR